jgi:hypothetical protein
VRIEPDEEPSEVREPAGRPRKAQANPVTEPGGDLRATALVMGLQVVRPDGPTPL